MHYAVFQMRKQEGMNDLPRATQPGSCRAGQIVVLAPKHSEAQTYSLAPGSGSGGGTDPGRKSPVVPPPLHFLLCLQVGDGGVGHLQPELWEAGGADSGGAVPAAPLQHYPQGHASQGLPWGPA